MTTETNLKVQARHLSRGAYLYVRQSTLRQVLENTESTERQYALRQRAMALGWRPEQIVVIDSDLGRSAASAVDREGFQRLVTEVGLGRAGIVMGLEVSRLARNSTDWHRLLEICALADSLILDEDGIYDPAHFNDRLLLGLKGTMSEAELHVLKARLRGGILNKARRGELEVRLPIGFVRDVRGRVRLDPDSRIQDSVRQLFRTFERTGSATATVRAFREEGLKFPHRAVAGPNKGDVLWRDLEHSRALWVLHNPRYTGAFAFGRSRQRRLPDGRKVYTRLEQPEWTAFVPGAHEGYLSWPEYERNVRRLRENGHLYGLQREHGAPREGPALLQGLVICAVCGERMTIRYHAAATGLQPSYVCQKDGIKNARPLCQAISGSSLDEAIGQLLIAQVTPIALQAALAVQKELEARSSECDALRRKEVERARYDTELARRRYMQVDPDNRLVADTLEAEWNGSLRALEQAQERYEQQRQADAGGLDEQQRASILALAKDFPRLWRDARTPQRERKRLARLLIADVTLLKRDKLVAQIRFNGGTTQVLELALPKSGGELRKTPADVVTAVDQLLDDYTDAEIAIRLNERGLHSGIGGKIGPSTVRQIRLAYGLRPRYDRLRARGLLTLDEVARQLNVCTNTVKIWRRANLLKAHRYSDRGEFLFEVPGPDAPVKHQHQGKMKALALAKSRSSHQPD